MFLGTNGEERTAGQKWLRKTHDCHEQQSLHYFYEGGKLGGRYLKKNNCPRVFAEFLSVILHWSKDGILVRAASATAGVKISGVIMQF